MANAPQLEMALQQALGEGRGIVVDLSEVTFIDSPVMHVLFKTDSALAGYGKQLVLQINTASVVMRALEITGLTNLPYTSEREVAIAIATTPRGELSPMATFLGCSVRCRPESLREVRDAVDTLDGSTSESSTRSNWSPTNWLATASATQAWAKRATSRVTAKAQRHLVRIDVHDAGSGFTLPDGQPRRVGGRGLAMVQALSTRVGISHDGETHAWAEIALAAEVGPRPEAGPSLLAARPNISQTDERIAVAPKNRPPG